MKGTYAKILTYLAIAFFFVSLGVLKKCKLDEGKYCVGRIEKITSKYVFVDFPIEGLERKSNSFHLNSKIRKCNIVVGDYIIIKQVWNGKYLEFYSCDCEMNNLGMNELYSWEKISKLCQPSKPNS